MGGKVGGGDDRSDTRLTPSSCHVHGGEAGMGMRTSHDPSPQRSGAPKVIDEPARAGEQTTILLAGQ
jgi:hypothetical protein